MSKTPPFTPGEQEHLSRMNAAENGSHAPRATLEDHSAKHNQDYRNQLADALSELATQPWAGNEGHASLFYLAAKALRSTVSETREPRQLVPGFFTKQGVYSVAQDGQTHCADCGREILVPGHALPSATLPTVPYIKTLRDQRDECADALRALAKVVEDNFPMPAGVHLGSPLDRARKALAKVPTYEQRLKNIMEAVRDAAE